MKKANDINIVLKNVGIDEIYKDIISFDFENTIEEKKDNYYQELNRYPNGILNVDTKDTYKYLRIDLKKSVFSKERYKSIIDISINKLLPQEEIKENQQRQEQQITVEELETKLTSLVLEKKALEDSLVEFSKKEESDSISIENLLGEIDRLNKTISDLQRQRPIVPISQQQHEQPTQE